MARDHRRLKVFQLADELAVGVYSATRRYPKEELFGLTSQMRRSAVSVAANIVEGCSRPSEADFLRFLVIAKGSLQEVGYYLHLSHRLGFLAEQDYDGLFRRYDECARRLQALINRLESAVSSGR
jgi:four helix bundle protein